MTTTITPHNNDTEIVDFTLQLSGKSPRSQRQVATKGSKNRSSRAPTPVPDAPPVRMPSVRRHEERSRIFSVIINRLSGKDIPGKAIVEDYFRDQYRRGCSANTLSNSFFVIDTFLSLVKERGSSELESIGRQDIMAYIEHEQDRGMKSSTVYSRVRSLKPFLRFLMGCGVVRSDLLSKRIIIKVPDPLPRAMDPEDESAMLEVLDDVRNRALLLVLLRTGMRIGELLNTLFSDVNLTGRKIDIYEAEKDRVGRVVYLSDDAVDALEAWCSIRDADKLYLFYAHGHQSMTYNTARSMIMKYLAKAGLSKKGYTLHCLRHTFASDLLNAGMRLECVQSLLGHASIEMTRRYARLTDRTREEEYFRAMATIERGNINGHYQLDHQLQTFLEEKKLLDKHSQELHEQP